MKIALSSTGKGVWLYSYNKSCHYGLTLSHIGSRLWFTIIKSVETSHSDYRGDPKSCRIHLIQRFFVSKN